MTTRPTFLRLDLPETTQRIWANRQIQENQFQRCHYCDALYIYRRELRLALLGEGPIAAVDCLQCACGARLPISGYRAQILGAARVPRPKPAPKPLNRWQRFWKWVWSA